MKLSVIEMLPCAPLPFSTKNSSTPWKARNSASVTTKDGIRTLAHSQPVTSPITRPQTSAAPIAAGHGQP